MHYQKIDTKYIFRIDKGEEVLTSLTKWCMENNISMGVLTGIGAVEYAEFGYYDLEAKEYRFTEYREMMEVVSMQGNISLKEGAPFLHVHAVFSGADNNARGGHVAEMVAGVVLEVVLEPSGETIHRRHDDRTGLFLMDLPKAS